MLICVQAPFTRTFDNKDRPWTPAVKRVAEPVMLRTTPPKQRGHHNKHQFPPDRR